MNLKRFRYQVVKRNKLNLSVYLIFFAFCVRLLYLQDVQKDPVSNVLILDSQSYQQMALRIVNGQGFPQEVFFQSPLYPVFLSVIYSIFGVNLTIVRLVQIIIDVMSVLLVMRYTSVTFGKKAGFVAGVGMSIYPVLIFQSCLILKTTLNVFFCALILYLVHAKRSVLQRFLLGLASGLAATNQGSMILFIPLLLLWIFIDAGVKIYKKWFIDMVIFLFGWGVIIAPVTYRNWKMGGEFVLLTAQGGANFYLGNSPYSDGTSKRPPHIRMTPEFERQDFHREAERLSKRKLTAHEASSFWFHEGIRWMKKNPLDAFKLQVRKFLLFWNRVEIPDNYDYEFYRLQSFWIKYPHYPFLILGMLAIPGMYVFDYRWSKLWFLYLWIIEYSFITISFHVYSRYRLPVITSLWPFAGGAVIYLIDNKRYYKKIFRFLFVMILVACFQSIRITHYTLAQTYFNRSIAWEKSGNSLKARELLYKALNIQPNYAAAYINLGKIHFQNGDTQSAEKFWMKAILLDPNSAELQSNLGVLALMQKRYDVASKYFEKAVDIQPYYFLGWLHLGQINQLLGKHQEAEKCFRKALQLIPDNPQALFGLAKTLDDEGDPRAKDIWKLYINSAQGIEKEQPYVQFALSRLNSVGESLN